MRIFQTLLIQKLKILIIRSSNIALSLVLHNEVVYIPRLVISVLSQTLAACKIYVTDNSSTDKSASLLKELLPDADIHFSKHNLGFAAAHNLNMKKAFSEDASAVFILNTDTEIDNNCISILNDFLMVHKETGIVAPMVLDGNSDGKTDRIQTFRIKASFMLGKLNSIDNQSKSGEINLPETAIVNYVTGTACVIRKEAFEGVGGFEESNFLYGEEMDFCYRASLKGIQINVLRDAKVWHYHDWSKKNSSGLNREYYYINRNRIRFFKKHKLKSSLLRFIINEIFISPLRIRWTLKTGGWSLVYFFYLGILHGLKGYSGKAIGIKGL